MSFRGEVALRERSTHVHAETPALVDHDFGGREEPLCGIAIQVREKPVFGEVGVFDDVGNIGGKKCA